MDVNINNLTVRFNDKTIYRDFSLYVSPGEFVCILGKSGCGKTVLLNTIMGNIRPSAGSVVIAGKEIHEPSRDIAMVYQDFSILPWMTLRENMNLVSSDNTKIVQLATTMKVDQYLDMLPKEVSIGTKQRFSIVRALLLESNIILMDEPLASVDAITAMQIRHDLKDLCTGKTTLLVTHNIDEALQLGSRIICLGRNGEITFDASNVGLSVGTILSHL